MFENESSYHFKYFKTFLKEENLELPSFNSYQELENSVKHFNKTINTKNLVLEELQKNSVKNLMKLISNYANETN